MNQPEMPTAPDPKTATSSAEAWKEILHYVGRMAEAFDRTVDDRYLERRREGRWKLLVRLTIIFGIVFSMALTWGAHTTLLGGVSSRGGVAVIPIHGTIGQQMASADRLVPLVRLACENEDTTGLVLRINSPGGGPSDAERIVAAIEDCRATRPDLPIHAMITRTGASAAYLIAASADEITASRYAIVGSIGAIMRTLDLSGLAQRQGVTEQSYASGPLKGGPSMWQPTTDAQAAANQAMVDEAGRVFLEQVRSLRAGKIDPHLDALRTGEVWVGEQALAHGLVDRIAPYEQRMAEIFGDAPIQWYRPKPDWQEQFSAETIAGALIAAVRGESGFE